MLLFLFMLYSEIDLKEQTPLESAKVTRLHAAAQGDGTVLAQWADIDPRRGFAIHNGFYDFRSGAFHLLKDGRLGSIAEGIVYDGVQYVIWHSERIILVDNSGDFQGIKRLNRFEGWETSLRIETMICAGGSVLASGHFIGQDGTHLIRIDFDKEALEFVHTFYDERYDRSYRHVPFGDGFLKIEQHGGEILQLDRNFRKTEVLRKRRPVVKSRPDSPSSRALGIRLLQPVTGPFVVTDAGLSCRYLKLHDEFGERLPETRVKALIVSKTGKVRIQDAFIMGAFGKKLLVYDAGEQELRLQE